MIEDIERHFNRALFTANSHKAMGITADYAAQLRYRMRNGIAIKLETKLQLLYKAGWRMDEAKYTRREVVQLLDAAVKMSKEARAMGGAYVLQKLESKK